MTLLTIHRWHNSYRAPRRLPPELMQQWEDGLQGMDLSREIDALVGSEELVFIRCLRFSTRLGEDQSPAYAAALWRSALLRELCESLEQENDSNVVFFRNRREAIADMLYRACCGDRGRHWVWVQMGLLREAGADEQTVIERAVAALQGEPVQIWPTLTRLILAEAQTGALGLLLRRLPPLRLQALLASCPQTTPFVQLRHRPHSAQAMLRLASNPLLRTLLGWIKHHRWQAQEQRAALTVLLAAAAHPADEALPASATQDELRLNILATAEFLFQQANTPGRELRRGEAGGFSADGTPPVAARDRDQRTELSPSQPPHPSTTRTSHAEDEAADELPSAPPLPDLAERVATEWGGLLFLLPLLPQTRCLQQLHELDGVMALSPNALRMVLWRLATSSLGAPASDAAVRAFCGGWQPPASLLDDSGALLLPAALLRISRQTAFELGELLQRRLPDDGFSLGALCQRPGILQFEPGWIELHLPLQCADTRLRRAALDLDPGWLPWLGCVVRFIYE